MRIRVGVIFGGTTVEHEISVISAVQAMNHMDHEKYDIVPIYITKDRVWYTGHMLEEIDIYKDFNSLKKYAKKVNLVRKDNRFLLTKAGLFNKEVAEIDIAFPIVHGNNMEDGTIHGYLQTIGIPYVGSGILGAAIGQDKVVMKQVMNDVGIPIVPYLWFFDTEYTGNREQVELDVNKLGYPVIVKPATLGSSVGIGVAKNSNELREKVAEAIKYDNKIVVEKVIENLIEVNCSVIGNYEHQETSAIEEVMSANEFLTYLDKYAGGSKAKGMAATNRIIPARINKKEEEEIIDLSKKVFRTLNLGGVCRIDFLIDKKSEKIYVNEPNTIPGSLSFYLWDPAGKPYPELLDTLITRAIKDYKNKAKKTYSFDTNILSLAGLKGTKGLKGIKK
ncbi:MAG: D-alanine--D-alanine ligase [Bacilli bacterium]|nr:D-alanine--D-alanine ligase [Bacilli bacterium]